MKIEFKISKKSPVRKWTAKELTNSAPLGMYRNTSSVFKGVIIKTRNQQVTYFDVENNQIYPFDNYWENHTFIFIQSVEKLTIAVE